MSSRLTVSASASGQSRSSQSNSQRRHRSRSTSRYADLDKPKKKKTLTATTSLVSIPNTIKLSMLNSGLLSFEKIKLEARDENNSLSQTIPDKPIELRNFVKLCEQRRKFPVLYKLEFQTAVKVETNTCRHATRKNNVEKNQNQKCIPYDYNRVVLEKLAGTPDSDYINASYVDSLLKPNAYIVTQGPTEETANDFWRMIWQENVSAIVMLTKTFDFTKVMCVQYWPPNVEIHETYGDIHINIVKEEQLANFHIRTFRLYKKNLNNTITEERFILQFHYTEWYSHTCPFSNAVLEFRRRVRAVVGNIIKPNSLVGPMLVHCNDGGGRSGVYLAIDANLELAEEEDCFHVFGYLKKLRQSRKGLVENVDQYKFVYDTLEEHVICGKTWFPVTELSERLKSKAKKDPLTKMNEYQTEYAQICKQTPRFTIGDCAGGHRADNREKNRDVLCVPPDNFRPYLTSFQGNAFTDYINSVFVDGYTKPREYIVTEWPLKHTLGEFWSLVYDHECSAVVVLCQPPPNSQQYPSFWPQKSKMEKYGPVFSVHFVSGKHYQNIKQWEFKINKKIISLTEMMAGVKAPTKTVQLFQLTCWPMGHKVPTSTNSLVFLMNMVELWRQRTDYGPVCVVSPDGRSRAGVYCAANACIEQVIQHGEVDVFQAVKTVRRHRPQLIENMTEYKYCYDLVLHYVLHFLDKDHKEKKFIAFGRGKCIPLTPENQQNLELPHEISNTGRIVVNKCIDKIDKREALLLQQTTITAEFNRYMQDRTTKITERKKKGRLYSLGGNEPQRKAYRGRLDRLKTVGTFDLGTEMCVLSEVAKNLNKQIMSGEASLIGHHPVFCHQAIIKTTVASISSSASHSIQNSKRNTPEVRKRDFGDGTIELTPRYSPFLLRSPSHDIKSNIEFKTQHSADDCIQKNANSIGIQKYDSRKARSLSTSSYLDRDRDRLDGSYTQNIDIDNRNGIEIGMKMGETKTTTTTTAIASRSPTCKTVSYGDKDITRKIYEQYVEDDQEMAGPPSVFKTRKAMLRKSRRIVRTDSEIFNEGICGSGSGSGGGGASANATTGDRNEIILRNNSEFQVHANPETSRTTTPGKTTMSTSSDIRLRDLSKESDRNSSIASSVFTRKDSSDLDDLGGAGPSGVPSSYHFHKGQMQKSTDESSKNPSTDEIDAVFSDSTTDLERLEKEYKELIKSNLQREYKSDGDTLDEVGKKRSDFGKWKNQSLEHEFELSNQELVNITGCQTLSSYSNETSGDVKDLSRICSPESCTNGAYSDSGLRKLDYFNYPPLTTPTGIKMRSRVYSSSRLGETPKERERLYHETTTTPSSMQPQIRTTGMLKSSSPLPISTAASTSFGGLLNTENIQLTAAVKKSPSRPSVLEIKPITQQQQDQGNKDAIATTSSEPSSSSSRSRLFDKPFGKFKKVNKLLKCKRFSASTLYDKKKSEEISADKGSSSPLHKMDAKEPPPKALEKKGTIHLSKLSLFSQGGKQSKTGSTGGGSSSRVGGGHSGGGFIASSTRKLGIFPNSSRSTNELCSKSTSKTKLCALLSKSNTEISKLKGSPSRFHGLGSRKSTKSTKKTNSSSCVNTESSQPHLHSPLSEEFYNKTGSVRLSAMELYEKFCSEDFGGLYKHEFKNDDQKDIDYLNQHEYRLEKKGLRVIGRYNKNAMLLKQKSEPKFNFRANVENDYYHEEDEEYYYTQGDHHEYYNEQDEYYGEYDDEYGEEIEGDFYEDEPEEGDFYEDEVNLADEPQYIDDQSNILIDDAVEDHHYHQHHHDQPRLVKQQTLTDKDNIDIITGIIQPTGDDKKFIEMSTGGGDSDIDEIYLMPEESGSNSGGGGKDYDKCGFENKQFTLEQSLGGKMMPNKNNSLDYLNIFDEFDLRKDTKIMKSFDSIYGARGGANGGGDRSGRIDRICNIEGGEKDVEILTIYKICSRESVERGGGGRENESGRTSEMEVLETPPEAMTTDTSTLKRNSLQPSTSVLDYVKLTKSESVIEPSTSISSSEYANVERTESLELLSNSSGTVRTHSTEYAFDTVKNLNMDSCSTSKLSLSLKSEVFDDFTITPDDLKPIQNCEFEDFTLTPEGSMSETTFGEKSSNIEKENTKSIEGGGPADTEVVDTRNEILQDEDYNVNGGDESIPYNEKLNSSSQDDECKNHNVIICDKFLENERKGSVTASSAMTTITILKNVNNNITTTSKDDSFCNDVEPTQPKSKDEDESLRTEEGIDSLTTQQIQEGTTNSDYTVIDLYDDDDEHTISLFTSELTKEFDRLFSKAEEFVQSSCSEIVVDKHLTSTRPEIPSRFSMQQLEPIYIEDPYDDEKRTNNIEKKALTTTTTTTTTTSTTSTTATTSTTSTPHNEYRKNISVRTPTSTTTTTTTTSTHSSTGNVSKFHFKRNRSKSLNNLNKKTKCFPL